MYVWKTQISKYSYFDGGTVILARLTHPQTNMLVINWRRMLFRFITCKFEGTLVRLDGYFV